MAGTYTTRTGKLYKPDTLDNVNVNTDLNANLDELDTFAMGFVDVANTAARPSTVWKGLAILQNDTGLAYVSNGSAPASGSWTQLLMAGKAASVTTLTTSSTASVGTNLSVAGSAAVTGNQTVGGNLTVTGIGQRRFAAVASDLSYTTTTLGNVTGLSFSLVSGATYEFEAVLMVNANNATNGDLKTAFSMPTSSTLHYIGYGPHNSTTTASGAGDWTAAQNVTSNDASPMVWGLTNSLTFGVKMQGTVTTTNSGNFILRAAQNSASNTSRILAGSYMVVTRVV